MGKIVILDENTANKIAAGEVIERPASVVKELVENSLDAGAESINIEIKNGGISFIKITDNGSGIREDDVEIAFERHATSKIRSADDLEHVMTMGFRGEALASIAAVSDVQVTSRVRDSDHGTFVEVKGGRTLDVRQTGCPVGTAIIVRDLFFNTPARFKFLKKDTTEAGYISEAITRIALGNPGVAFKLVTSGSSVVHTPGNNDQLSAIFSIYGKETARNVCPVNYADDRIKISGYAGKPEIARANRSHQYVYINRRFIKSKIITSAVDEAYNTFLMKNRFPFLVLNVKINPMLVDVNVHPTKMEVKFSNEQEIFKAVYHAIQNALLVNTGIRQAVISEKPAPNPFRMEEESHNGGKFEQQSIRLTVPGISLSGRKIEEVASVEEREARLTPSAEGEKTKAVYSATWKADGISSKIPLFDDSSSTYSVKNTSNASEAKVADVIQAVKSKVDKDDFSASEALISETQGKEPQRLETQGKEAQGKAAQVMETRTNINHEKESRVNESEEEYVSLETPASHLFNGVKIVGQLFSTYIILQKDDQMILIDQHAAHERVMYEELKKRFDSRQSMSQLLLDTVVVELTHQELKLLEEEKEYFFRLGFEFEPFGSNSVILRAVPFSSLGQDARLVFVETLDRMLGKAKSERVADTDETLYTIACKAAVKANKRLDEAEMKNIPELLSKLENPFTCPHGRPSAIKISKYQLEKMFKRIV